MHDYVIVGAGVIGLLSARELALGGARVLVLERGEAGRESSWAGGGILSPLRPWQQPDAVTRLVQWGQTTYPHLVQDLLEETGVDAQWRRCGLLMLDEDQHETVAAGAWARLNHVPMDPLRPHEVAEKVGGLGLDDPEGLWWPEVAQLRNPRLVQALKESIRHKGVTLREGEQVHGLIREKDHIVGVETSRERISAGTTIVATGAWTRELLGDLDLSLQVEPVRGQILLYRADKPLFSPVIGHGDHYLIPRNDGHILVGSTVEHAGFDKSTTDAGRRALEAAARQIMPALADYPVVQHWAGLRPGSPHGIPVIGPHPTVRGLYLNTGHFRNGLSLAPGSARLLVDLIFDAAATLDPAPYLPV